MQISCNIFVSNGGRMEKILIIGGGASGMAAAIRAAEDSNRSVTLLERQPRVGKKLAATGNGRCNLTNLQAATARYHGEDPGFADPVLRAYPPERVLEFFSRLGLKTVTEYGGRVYPLSDHAGSVLDVLRLALEQMNVSLLTDCPAEAVRRDGAGFSVTAGGRVFSADRLILACGGCAGSRLGGVMDGYALAGALGHGLSIAAGMAQLDEPYADIYMDNLSEYLARLEDLADDMENAMARARPRPVAVLHEGLGYLARQLKLEIACEYPREPGSEQYGNDLDKIRRPEVVLVLDCVMRGIGNGSCGPGPMRKYEIERNKDYSYKFRISK